VIKTYFPWVIALLAVSAAVYGYYNPKTVTQTHETVTLRPVAGKTVYKLKECLVEAKNAISGVLPIATGVIPQAPYGGEVVSNLTPSTGDVNISFTPKTKPLFSFENDKEIGLRYGLRDEVQVFGRWTFLRVGSFYGAFYGQADSDKEWNAMAEVSYRW